MQEKFIQDDGCPYSVASFYLNIQEGATLGIDTSSLIQIRKQAIHASAVIKTGTANKSTDKNPNGLGCSKARTLPEVCVPIQAGGMHDPLVDTFQRCPGDTG